MKLLTMAILIVAILGGATMAKPGEVAMAETDYTEAYLLFVDASKLNTANNLARNWDPELEPGNTFTVPLSPTGAEPATHYAVSTRATPTMSAGITNALSNLSWAYMYQTENVMLDDLAVWTGPDDWTFVGSVGDAWDAALLDMGLVRIIPEI